MDLELHELGKVFPGTGEALRDVNLRLPGGSFVTFLGPSGCGKSTVLRLIAGLERPTSGAVRWDGAERERPHGVSFVFQEPRLLPWRRALANVVLPLELAGAGRPAEWQAAGERALRLVGLGDFVRAYPDQLSGGMKMRVSRARALVSAPSVLLLDEPFGALDEITREALNDELLRLWGQERWTAVFVTHNIFESVYLSQQIVVMGRRPGRVLTAIKVPFPYPRQPELRATAEFAACVGELQRILASTAG